MKKERRHSYGVIPIYKEDEQYLILLVDQRDSTRNEYWTFAKGTPEEGETSLETAIRETKEETSIEFDAVVDSHIFMTHPYTFQSDGVEVDKQVTYYIGFVKEKDFKVDGHEIVKAKWCTFDEARSLITYEDTRVIVNQVQTYLETQHLDNRT